MNIKYFGGALDGGRKREMGSLALSVTQASWGWGPGHRMWLSELGGRETLTAVTLASCWNKFWEPGFGEARRPEGASRAF